eukprot:1391961-Amorphochlora_amoeboformis.AAC.1
MAQLHDLPLDLPTFPISGQPTIHMREQAQPPALGSGLTGVGSDLRPGQSLGTGSRLTLAGTPQNGPTLNGLRFSTPSNVSGTQAPAQAPAPVASQGSGLPPQSPVGLPPPPDLSQPAPKLATKPAIVGSPKSRTRASPPASGRSKLLESIRNFKGSKNLKKSSLSDKRKKKKKVEAPPPGDLMANLRARLARHRAAMSGSKPSRIARAPESRSETKDSNLALGLPDVDDVKSHLEPTTPVTRKSSFEPDVDGWESG